MAENTFDFQAFLEESKQTLINPKEYFKSMAKSGGFVAPIIKAIIYGLAAGVISFLLSIFHIGLLSGFLGTTIGIGSIIILPIYALIGIFIGGVLILIISAICGGSTEFEPCVRIAAALTVLYPINSILPIFYHIGFYLEVLIGLCVSVYGLWLLYNAVIESLNGKQEVMKIVGIVLAALVLISSIVQITTWSTVRSYQNNSAAAEKYLKEYMEQTQKTKENQQK